MLLEIPVTTSWFHKKPADERHRPWEIVSSREIYSAPPWIQLSLQTVRLPDGRLVDDYHSVKMPDYAVIYAETSAGKVIVEKQYKHGVGKVTLSLPAGLIEPGEDPLKAAHRELREETGYEGAEWQSMGSFVPNSNYGCGRAHLFHVRAARRVTDPDAGDLEDIELLLLTPEELLSAMESGEVASTSMALAIAMAGLRGRHGRHGPDGAAKNPGLPPD